MKTEKEGDEELCPQCGNWYLRIATHWAQSSECGYPSIPRKIKDILYGMSAVSGTFEVRKKKRNRYITRTTDEEKLIILRNVFGIFANDVFSRQPDPRDNGFIENPGERSKTYHLQIKPHPEIQQRSDLPYPKYRDLSMKAVFLLRGVIAYPNSYETPRVRVGAKKAERLDKISNAHTSKSVYDNNGYDFYNYRYPIDYYNKIADIKWPVGWWNERYI